MISYLRKDYYDLLIDLLLSFSFSLSLLYMPESYEFILLMILLWILSPLLFILNLYLTLFFKAGDNLWFYPNWWSSFYREWSLLGVAEKTGFTWSVEVENSSRSLTLVGPLPNGNFCCFDYFFDFILFFNFFFGNGGDSRPSLELKELRRWVYYSFGSFAPVDYWRGISFDLNYLSFSYRSAF